MSSILLKISGWVTLILASFEGYRLDVVYIFVGYSTRD